MRDMLYVFAGFKYYPNRPSGDYQGRFSLTEILGNGDFIDNLKEQYDWYEMWMLTEDGMEVKHSWKKEY